MVIELKRDAEDERGRTEGIEFQAIRYAASSRKMTGNDVVDLLAHNLRRRARKGEVPLDQYRVDARHAIEAHHEYEPGSLTEADFDELIDPSTQQKIYLVAADFDPEVTAACAWLREHDPQISTDGWGPYQPAIRREFGSSVGHGVLVKGYADPNVGRYAPPKLIGAERTNIRGISDLFTICTSHVERLNLTIRTFMRRFTRLAIGFSKKLENLVAATALHVGTYNFLRRHRSLEGCTPAMAAGVVDTLWTWDTFYDAVMEQEQQRKRREGVERMLRRMREVTESRVD